LYEAALPKRLAPFTTDPAAGAVVIETPPAGDGLTGAGDALIVGIPVAGAAGLVLEHPATATATTTNIIAVILIGEIFIFSLQV
jgi:hypothetical protein